MQIIVINDLDLRAEWDKINAGIEEGLDDVATQVRNDFLRPTKQWDHKPQFEIESKPKERTIFTTDENYIRINNGTNRSGYTEGKPRLWLPSHFVPKTRSGDLYGYGGVKEYERGKNVFRRVKKSSIKARLWDEWIYKLWTEYIDIGDYIQRKINGK